MVDKKRSCCIKHAKKQCILGSIFGVIPLYDFEKNEIYLYSFYRYYAFLLIVVTLFGSLYQFIERIKTIYILLKPTVAFVDAVAYVGLSFANVYYIVAASFIHSGNVTNLFKILSLLDKKSKCENSGCKYFILCSIAYATVLVFSLADSYFWLKFGGWNIWKPYCMRYFQNFQMIIFVFMVNYFVTTIKNKYEEINDQLTSLIYSYIYNDMVQVTHILKLKPLKNADVLVSMIKDLIKKYTIVCEVIETFNKIYGWLILILTFNILLGLLSPISLVLAYITPEDKLVGESLGIELIIINMIWGGVYLVLGIILASCCDKATNEAKKIAITSFKLIQDVPDLKLKANEGVLKEELIILAHQASLNSPKFSAAGFFNIDYTMLYNILGSVTSYIVVIVQFNK